MNYELDGTEAKELLRNTFIKPEKTDVLFELYWIIKVIESFNKKEGVKFNLIESGQTNLLAHWRLKNYQYKLYHDSKGESCQFHEKLKEISKCLKEKDNYLGRLVKVLEKLEKTTGIQKGTLWGGRPDILLEKYDESRNLVSIFIGEVKYTRNKDYIIQGFRELLEYMALIKNNSQYVEDYQDLFRNLKIVKGALFIDKTDNLGFKSCGDIQVKMFGDVIGTLI